MIPVKEENYILIDLDKDIGTVEERRYIKLLKEQLSWLNANYNQVKNKSYKLYQMYNSGKLISNIQKR